MNKSAAGRNVFNKYRGRIKFVCEGVNDWVKDGS
jgi:hypothetical protein